MVHRRGKVFMLVLVLIMIFIMQSVKVAAETNSLTYEGKDFIVEIKFTNSANISENAILKVTEFYEGSEEYQECFSQTDEFIKQNIENQILCARFFDICIMENGKEIEPDDTVEVSIKYQEGIEKQDEDTVSIIHFVEDGETELIEVKEEVMEEELLSQISFEQDSFSIIGMIVFDGIDSNVKDVGSETVSKMISFDVEKEWSDGYEIHEDDEVTISLYEISSDEWEKCDEIILNQGNGWKGTFKNLDKSKEYGIRETKVTSKNEDIKASYQSTITSTTQKEWCPKDDNSFSQGERIILVFGNSTKRILRKSSDTNEMNLRFTYANLVEDDEYGKYCANPIESHETWESFWNSDKKAWELYHLYGNAYLTLSYDVDADKYVWVASKEKTEGSYLNFEGGKISATVNGVKKYLGNISDKGLYEGLDEGDEGIEIFQIYAYQVFRPGTYKIINTKNETVEAKEIQADVITEKKIDYLGDGTDNPDTDVDNREFSEKILEDLYRLELNLKMQTDVTGLDLLMVIDVSSSMNSNKDCKDSNGNYILRSEALRQALNQFVPELLPEDTKNRISIVAFENQSIILQDWTQNSEEVLGKVNDEVDGRLPLYDGEGTNYEAALSRAHEALTKRGYSGNAAAMIFLSDGEPTVYIYGNDDQEAGNVTVGLGEASLSDLGIEGTLPETMRNVWSQSTDDALVSQTNEAIQSFKNHNPEIMIGTIAFNTKITDYLRNLSTDQSFVTQIENGTPNDLINAMQLITNYVPKEISVVDELSEYVELYEEEPDFKVTLMDKEGKETILISPDDGITETGKDVLDDENPLEVEGKEIRMNFQKNHIVKNGHIYKFSFNVKASQNAYNQYADNGSNYTDIGDEETDYQGNATSSLKEGFYSNGDGTKVKYSLNGAVIEKKYRKPVIQVTTGSFTIKKEDLDGNEISKEALFTLYRAAGDDETNTISLDGIDTEVVKVAEGTTNENGELRFEHLRVSVFDEGYLYYLVEEKEPEGYIRYEKPIQITLFKNSVETEKNNSWVYIENNNQLIVRNAEYVEPIDIPVTGGSGTDKFYLIGIIFITGGFIMIRKKNFSKILMIVMTIVMAFQMMSATVFAIESTDKGTITVNSVEEGVTVSSYRLMDINFDYDVQQPKNPMYKWVSEVSDWVSKNYPTYIDVENQNEVKETFAEAKDAEVAKFYDQLAVAIKDGTVNLTADTVEASSEAVTISGLTMGNYFILIEGGVKVYRPLTANVVPEWKDNVWQMSTPIIEAKSSEPSITKTVTAGLKKDNANVGDTISFELNAVIAVYPDNAKAKNYVVSDQLSNGLSFVSNSLKVYGMNSGKDAELIESGYTKTVDGTKSFVLDFNYEAISSYESLKVTYDTVLNENAVVGQAGNQNTALLKYSNNPYITDDFSTDSDETTVYTYGMKISKIDEDSNEVLTGAEFTLSKDETNITFAGENGVYHVAKLDEAGSVTVTVDENGMLTLNGLDAGTYYLTETKAPDGYVKLQNPIEIVIDDDNMNGSVEVEGQELDDGYVPVTVKNDKGFILPVTGGMGTTLFNIAGVILMGTGIVLLVLCFHKRKKSK